MIYQTQARPGIAGEIPDPAAKTNSIAVFKENQTHSKVQSVLISPTEPQAGKRADLVDGPRATCRPPTNADTEYPPPPRRSHPLRSTHCPSPVDMHDMFATKLDEKREMLPHKKANKTGIGGPFKYNSKRHQFQLDLLYTTINASAFEHPSPAVLSLWDFPQSDVQAVERAGDEDRCSLELASWEA